MWIYEQTTGKLYHNNELWATGYSGYGVGKNNPDMENVEDLGPIPAGRYTFAAPVDTERHGPYVLGCCPHPDDDLHGRGGFLCHGDNKKNPGTASHGCIIMPRIVRGYIWNSGDHELLVVRVKQ